MIGMFKSCESLEILDLSNFDTSHVTAIQYMFFECKNLKQIKGINNFNTINAINMHSMFAENRELIFLDLTKFNTCNVTDMEYMFYECIKLKEIKGINNFNTINVTKMTGMFENCNELEYLDLSNFNTSKVTDMGSMFKKCYKLKEIKGINNFDISKVINKEKMFEECNENLDSSKFNFDDNTNKNPEKLKNKLKEEKKKNLELIDIIKLRVEKPKELMAVSEKTIAILFRTTDQNVNKPIACKYSDSFSSVEEKLYEEYPDLRNNVVFIAIGKVINRSNTIEQNKIKDGDHILVDKINV